MAEYTMELRQIVNSDCHQVFDFYYPFYCDNEGVKQAFEELFIKRYYFHEIGAETIERWKWQLKARLHLIMPYYNQLYQTEWQQTQKDMMLSKSLVETLTREITLEGSNESSQTSSGTHSSLNEQSQSGSDKITNEQSQTGTSSSSGTSEGTSSNQMTTKESSINDGVGVVNLDTDNLTLHSSQDSTGDSSATTSGESSSTTSSESTDEQQLTGLQNTTSSSELSTNSKGSNNSQSSSTGTNQSKQIETQTFISEGDVGIQTPAYAIAEWRKIIININEMILNDCKDLFMLIY